VDIVYTSTCSFPWTRDRPIICLQLRRGVKGNGRRRQCLHTCPELKMLEAVSRCFSTRIFLEFLMSQLKTQGKCHIIFTTYLFYSLCIYFAVSVDVVICSYNLYLLKLQI
jgi:hypothetical protein